MAEYAPWPLRLTFAVYLAVLAVVTVLIWRTRETVARPGRLADVSMRPRLSVPGDIRARFVAPAVTGFGAMALVGFYAARRQHPGTAAACDQPCRSRRAVFRTVDRWRGDHLGDDAASSRTTMLAALVLMIPTVALVVAAQFFASMPIMIAATACSAWRRRSAIAAACKW